MGRSGHLVQKVFTKHLLFTRCDLRTYKDGHTGGFVGVLGWGSVRKMEDVKWCGAGEGVPCPESTYHRGYGRKQGRPGAADGGEAGAQAAEKTWQRLAAEMIPAEVDGGHRRPWRTGGSALSLGLLVTEKSPPGGKGIQIESNEGHGVTRDF